MFRRKIRKPTLETMRMAFPPLPGRTTKRSHYRDTLLALVLTPVLTVCAVATSSVAGAQEVAVAALSTLDQVPAQIEGSRGGFFAEIDGLTSIAYTLSYDRIDSDVAQAHIHIGQAGVNGGVIVFLCSNLGNGPAGTPMCPASGEVSGTLTGADVIPVDTQGISSLASVIRAMRQGVAYVNVHTSEHPGGELRGQIAVGGPR